MWQVLYFGVMLVASVAATTTPKVGYHTAIGIPTAKRIKEFEENRIVEQNLLRIVGGSLAPRNAYPFFAGLWIDVVNENVPSVCGASLLSASRLVTAGHCWFDGKQHAWRFTVILGSQYWLQGGTRIPTDDVIIHPFYNPWEHRHDIAMINLHTDVIFNQAIAPIDLPRGPELQRSFVGEWATAIGFGKTNSEHKVAEIYLSHVRLQVISVEQCRRRFPVDAAIICTSPAGHVGICQGDSGGPLAMNLNGRPVLIGVSVFTSLYGCDDGSPSGFSRITAHYDFITQLL